MIAKAGDAIAELNEKIKKASGIEKENLKKQKDNLQKDLNKFKKDRVGHEKTWNALNDRNAFDNTVKVLEPNDMIEFYVDPTFPEYNGSYQILLTVVKNGQRYVLNTLSAQTDQYYGLYELRKAIDREYQEHIKKNPNTPFVFSKKSRVWAKRDGLVEYDYNREHGKYKEEKGIKNIRAYDENMPIAFIDRNGNAVVINGKDKTAVDKVSTSFNDPVVNTDQKQRVGNLYYLAYVGDKKYVPIRLWVEHFRDPSKSNPIFDKIKGLLSNIANLTKSANEENFSEKHQQMLEKLKELGSILNIGGYNFQIGNFGGEVGVALRMAPADDNQNNTFRRADQITPEWLINHIASLGLSLQIKLDENGNMPNIQEYIDNDLITSNAKMLRPKGMDFYFVAWDDKAKDFVATPSQQQILDEENRAETYEAPATTNEEEESSESSESIELDDDEIVFDREDFGDFNIDDEEEEIPEPAPVAEDENADYQAKAVEEHAKEINDKFVNSMSDKIKNVPAHYTLAKIITIMASQGASRYAAVVRAMTNYFGEDKPIANRISDWKTIFNSLFTKEEKQNLHDAISRKLGIDASEASAYLLMEIYKKRMLSPRKANDADEQIIYDAFTRMWQAESNLDIISALFTPAYASIGFKDDSFNAGEDIGVIQDLSNWDNIPASVQSALEEKKCLGKQQWSKEEWESDKMTDSLRDQALRCATV